MGLCYAANCARTPATPRARLQPGLHSGGLGSRYINRTENCPPEPESNNRGEHSSSPPTAEKCHDRECAACGGPYYYRCPMGDGMSYGVTGLKWLNLFMRRPSRNTCTNQPGGWVALDQVIMKTKSVATELKIFTPAGRNYHAVSRSRRGKEKPRAAALQW